LAGRLLFYSRRSQPQAAGVGSLGRGGAVSSVMGWVTVGSFIGLYRGISTTCKAP
jgi:hypothetical protein